MVLISAYCTVAADCGGFVSPLVLRPTSEYIGSLAAPVAPVDVVVLAAPVGVLGCLSVDCYRKYGHQSSVYIYTRT